MKSSMEDFTMLSEKTIDSKNLERYRYFSFQATVNSIPVSYTHLDVYKRQANRYACPCSLSPCVSVTFVAN